jgi:hypothetical protein
MIHILDLQNSVLTVSNGIVLEKEDCIERQTAEAPVVKDEFKHFFKKHGTYFGNGRSLNFLAIWNDKRNCHSIFSGDDDPCLKLNKPLN